MGRDDEMKMILILIGILAVPQWGFCQTHSPAVQGTNNLAEATQKGEAQAKADISKGISQILYYGKPWSEGKPLVDEQSQLPVKIVAGCDVTREFVAETDAYNAVMSQTAKAKKEKTTDNHAGTCSCWSSENPRESAALPQYSLRLISYDGPSMGGGLSGWVVMEVDVTNYCMRVLKQRVAYTNFAAGIPPARPPYDRVSLAKAISDVPWRPIPSQETASLQNLIHAWVQTTPPGEYKCLKSDIGWPGHTTITVQTSSNTITSVMACKYANPPYTDDTGEMHRMLEKLSYLEVLWNKGTHRDRKPHR